MDLVFLAGETAYKRIKENGLSPDDVKMAVGASGAAKWLVLHGLDTAVFAHWLKGKTEPVHLFGTSIGAWKLAAAAQANPAEAFDRLADAYIHQYYDGKPTPKAIAVEAKRMMNLFMPRERVKEILSHPVYRFSLSAVKCKGLTATDHPLPLLAGLMAAFTNNLLTPQRLTRHFQRTLFHDHRALPPMELNHNPHFHRVALTPENFRKALLASGSIPLAMEGVTDIPGAPDGLYRDGGIVDYHPALPFLPKGDGIAIYPHFYPRVVPGWFDKNIKGRVASASQLDNVLLLAPSESFVSKLPYGRIPDRRDFNRMRGRDRERVAFWETTVRRSRRLGEAFLNAVETGKIKQLVQKL